MRRGIHLRQLKSKIIQTDGSSLSYKINLPSISLVNLKSVKGFRLELTQDTRSHKQWSAPSLTR